MSAPAARTIRVLLVAGDPRDAEQVCARLSAEGIDCHVTQVAQLDELAEALGRPHAVDLVLAGYAPPALDGFAAVDLAAARCPEVPLVLLADALGDEHVAEALRRGASDYVPRGRLERLAPAVRRALRGAEDRRERHRAAERTERLQALAAALVAALSPAEVAQVSVAHGLGALEAQHGACWLLAGDGGAAPALELAYAAGFSAATSAAFARVPTDAPVPVAAALRDGAPVWIESRAQYQAAFPAAAAATEMDGPDSAAACLPLSVGGRRLGALAFTFARARLFSTEERALLLALTRQCAQALDRARLYAAERDASQRFALLARASDVLAASLDHEVTLQNIAGLAMPLLADFGFFDVLETDDSVRRIARAHEDPATEALLAGTRWVRSERTDINLCALSSGAAAFHPDVTDAWMQDVAASPEHLALLRGLGFCSMISVPLELQGRTLGALTLFFARSGRRHTEADLRLAEEIAHRAAAAVANARLFRDAQEAERRAQFLAEASRVLAAALSVETMLQIAAELSVPRLGDWCFADVLESDGTIHRCGVAYRAGSAADADADAAAGDARCAALAARFRRRYARRPELGVGVSVALQRRAPQLIADAGDEFYRAVARDEDHLAALREMAARSVLIVPMIARGRALGSLTFAWTTTARRYTEADMPLAEELAQRTALAVDNARLLHEAQDANRLKDEFLATVSHELRTPLTAMLGWTRLLRTGAMPEERRARALETIERNATAQAQLVEDLLDINRIITGKLRLNVGAVDIATVIEMAVEAVRPAADARGVQLELLLAPDAGTVRGDPDRLQQVVWNLLSNAVKFTPRGGRVETRVVRDEAAVEIAVADTGQGIDPAFLPHVFERFRQADASSTRTQGGLGLGLAIVRQLVELHGGAVEAHSAGAGRGAAFTVRLPVAPSRTSRPTGPPLYPAGGAGARPSGRLDGVRVLVVDDEPDTRELLASVLEGAHASVEAVGSAPEAFDALRRAPPDVLVSDISMPGEDGYALIQRVRALPAEQGGRVRALAVTAYARAEDRAAALAAGFDAHVAKPVEPAVLVGSVAGLLSRDDAAPAT